MHKHQSNGTGADDHHGVAGSSCCLFEATDDTGERLRQGSILQGNPIWDQQGILLNDTCRNTNVLGVGAIVEEKIFAEILLTAKAEETPVAGGGVQSDDAIPLTEVGYARTYLGNGTGDLVAKEDWRLQHHRVVSAPVDLKIGPACQSGSYADHQLSRIGTRGLDPLQAQVFLSIENRRDHLTLHPYYLLISRASFLSPYL
jgi:hypothetical protein